LSSLRNSKTSRSHKSTGVSSSGLMCNQHASIVTMHFRAVCLMILVKDLGTVKGKVVPVL